MEENKYTKVLQIGFDVAFRDDVTTEEIDALSDAIAEFIDQYGVSEIGERKIKRKPNGDFHYEIMEERCVVVGDTNNIEYMTHSYTPILDELNS